MASNYDIGFLCRGIYDVAEIIVRHKISSGGAPIPDRVSIRIPCRRLAPGFIPRSVNVSRSISSLSVSLNTSARLSVIMIVPKRYT